MRTKFYFSALETGWCFPESLSTATVPGRPRNPDIPIPTIEQYVALVNEGLARTALDAIDGENDPAKQAAYEAKIEAFQPIVWKHEIKPAI